MAYTIGDLLDATYTVLDDAGTPVLGLVPSTIIARDPGGADITFTHSEAGNGIYRAVSDQPAGAYGTYFLQIAANDAEGQRYFASWDVDPPQTVLVANQMAQQVMRPVLADHDGTFDSRYLKKNGPLPAVKIMDVLADPVELPMVGRLGDAYVIEGTGELYVWTSANTWQTPGTMLGTPGPDGPIGETGPEGPAGPPAYHEGDTPPANDDALWLDTSATDGATAASLADVDAAVADRITAAEADASYAAKDLEAAFVIVLPTDSTAQIQAKLNTLRDAGGGTAYFVDGTYTITASLRVASNVTLQGNGYTTHLQAAAGTTVNVIRADTDSAASPVTGVTIRNLRIDGNKANQSDGGEKFGISLIFANDCTVERVWVHDTVRTGIYMAGARNRVRDCDVVNCGYVGGPVAGSGKAGIAFDGLSGAAAPVQCQAIGNRVRGSYEHGIKLYPDGDGAVIADNIIENCGDQGIAVQSADDVAITGNTVVGCGKGITLHATTGVVTGGAVNGNTVLGCIQHGIHLWNGRGPSATGNVVRGCGGHGIYVESCNGWTAAGNLTAGNGLNNTYGSAGICFANSPNGAITGNTSHSNGNATSTTNSCGVWSFGAGVASNDVVITGNRCYDDGSGRQHRGVKISDTPDFLLIVNNNLRGNLTQGLTVVTPGAGSVTTPNITA